MSKRHQMQKQPYKRMYSGEQVQAFNQACQRIEHAFTDIYGEMTFIFGVVGTGISANSDPAIYQMLELRAGTLVKHYLDLVEMQRRAGFALYDERELGEVVQVFSSALEAAASENLEPIKQAVEQCSIDSIRELVSLRHDQPKRGAPSKQDSWTTMEIEKRVNAGATIQAALEDLVKTIERRDERHRTSKEKAALREINDLTNPVEAFERRLARKRSQNQFADKIILSGE